MPCSLMVVHDGFRLPPHDVMFVYTQEVAPDASWDPWGSHKHAGDQGEAECNQTEQRFSPGTDLQGRLVCTLE